MKLLRGLSTVTKNQTGGIILTLTLHVQNVTMMARYHSPHMADSHFVGYYWSDHKWIHSLHNLLLMHWDLWAGLSWKYQRGKYRAGNTVREIRDRPVNTEKYKKNPFEWLFFSYRSYEVKISKFNICTKKKKKKKGSRYRVRGAKEGQHFSNSKALLIKLHKQQTSIYSKWN